MSLYMECLFRVRKAEFPEIVKELSNLKMSASAKDVRTHLNADGKNVRIGT